VCAGATSLNIHPNLLANAWICVMLGAVVRDSSMECLMEAVENIKPGTANCKALQIILDAMELGTIWIFTFNIAQ